METPALYKLLDRCNEMDITEQINWLGDVNMPFNAKKELAALKSELAAKDELLAECARVIAPLLDFQREYTKLTINPFDNNAVVCRLNNATLLSGHINAAAELAKKLEGMK